MHKMKTNKIMLRQKTPTRNSKSNTSIDNILGPETGRRDVFLGHLLSRLELLFAALGDRTAGALGRLTQHHSLGLRHSEEQVWVQLGEARIAAEHRDVYKFLPITWTLISE